MATSTAFDVSSSSTYDFQDWPGPVRAKINGFSTSKTISITSLKSITIGARVQAHFMAWDGADGYSECYSNPTITIRENNSSGAVLATNAGLSEAQIESARARGVTHIYIAASTPTSYGPYNCYQYGGNYTSVYDGKARAYVYYTTYDYVPVRLDGANALKVALDGTVATHVKYDGTTVY